MELLKKFEHGFRFEHSNWFRDPATRQLSGRLESAIERFFNDVGNRPGTDPEILGKAKVLALLNCLHAAVVDQLRSEGRVR